MSWRAAWLTALALAAAAALPPAWGGDADGELPMVEGLSASLHTPILLPRPNAPWPIVVTLTMRSSGLREGELEVDVSEGGRPLSRWQGDARVLVSGVTTFPILMPPMALGSDHDQLSCRLRWHEHGSTIDLGRVSQPMAGEEQRLYLAQCLPLAASAGTRTLQRDLSLEYYRWRAADGDETTRQADREDGLHGLRVRTVPVRLTEEDCPETALGWCAYDAVVIVGDRLRSLKTRQVQVLESWILAGGSCCLVCDGELPALMAELVSRAGLADPGRPGVAAAGHVRLRYGLGRIVVARPEEERQGEEAERTAAWAASAAFLWKVRHEWADAIARTGSWGRRDQDSAPGGAHSSRQAYRSYRSVLRLDDELTQLLWPEHVEVVPIRIILAVFIVFILMIGPGEWYLLGWLRARRFTWLVFPALAILCTWTMAWISRLYLGSNDVRQHLEIVDVGPGGTTLRRSSFELLFTGATRIVHDETHDALRSALAEWRSSRSPSGNTGTDRVVEYHGSLPGHYTVTRTVAQWTPALMRETALSAPPLPWRPDLDAISRPSDVEIFARKWLKQASSQAAVVLVRPGFEPAQWGDTSLLRTLQVEGRRTYAEADMFSVINTHPKDGLFALVSRMSPAGGALYDDLAILDGSDPGDFAVVCLERRDGAKWMVRRLFHSAPSVTVNPQ